MTISDVYFGQGGNEYVVPRPAPENVVTRYRAHQRESMKTSQKVTELAIVYSEKL
jgi:hypothetical protein